MKFCRCCGQPVQFPGIYLTEARYRVLTTIIRNSGIWTVLDLTHAVYPRRAISWHTVGVHLHHLRTNLLDTDWKILNKPYRVVHRKTGRLATYKDLPELPRTGDEYLEKTSSSSRT